MNFSSHRALKITQTRVFRHKRQWSLEAAMPVALGATAYMQFGGAMAASTVLIGYAGIRLAAAEMLHRGNARVQKNRVAFRLCGMIFSVMAAAPLAFKAHADKGQVNYAYHWANIMAAEKIIQNPGLRTARACLSYVRKHNFDENYDTADACVTMDVVFQEAGCFKGVARFGTGAETVQSFCAGNAARQPSTFINPRWLGVISPPVL